MEQMSWIDVMKAAAFTTTKIGEAMHVAETEFCKRPTDHNLTHLNKLRVKYFERAE